MNAYVVVEGSEDVAILRAVLPADLLRKAELVEGGGRSNLTSIARTLLVTRHKPVAVVIDTDSVDQEVVQNRSESTTELLRAVSPGIPFKVILMIPTIESLFFQAPGLLEKVFGAKIPDEVRLLARVSPKEALSHLFARSGDPRTLTDLLEAFDEEGLESLRSTGPLQELIHFLQEVGDPSQKQTVG